MQSRMLLDVRQLLEAPVTVGTFVRFLSGVHPNVLHQLVVAAEALQTLLALMRLHLGSASNHSADATQTGRSANDSAGAGHVVHRTANSATLQIPGVLHLHGALVHEDLYLGGRKRKENGVRSGTRGISGAVQSVAPPNRLATVYRCLSLFKLTDTWALYNHTPYQL